MQEQPWQGWVESSTGHLLVYILHQVLAMMVVVLGSFLHRLDSLDHYLSRSVDRSGLRLQALDSSRMLQAAVGTVQRSVSQIDTR